MTDIPKAICGTCMVPMSATENGVRVEMLDRANFDAASDKPYFKVQADEFGCPMCDYRIIIGFALLPEAFASDGADYDEREADRVARYHYGYDPIGAAPEAKDA